MQIQETAGEESGFRRETLADTRVDGNMPVKWGKWMIQKGGERITGATSMRDKRAWGL